MARRSQQPSDSLLNTIPGNNTPDTRETGGLILSSIATGESETGPAREFNRLVRETGELDKQYQDLENLLSAARRRYANEIIPEFETLAATKLSIIDSLDQWLHSPVLRKREKEKVLDAIRYLISEIERRFAKDLESLWEKYGEDKDYEQYLEDMKTFLENLNEHENSFSKSEARHSRDAEDKVGGSGPRGQSRSRKTKAGKSGSGAGFKEEFERDRDWKGGAEGAIKMPQDIKALYIRLSRILHPDLEPDLDKKAVKTEWMKKVTQAYQENDLFSLLKILVNNPFAATEGRNMLRSASEAALNHFIRLLKEQKLKLKSRLETLKANEGFFYEQFCRNPGKTELRFREARRTIRVEQETALSLQEIFQNESSLKAFLKSMDRAPLEILL